MKNDLEFLQPRESRFYPPDNKICFEEWFLDNYDESRNKSDRIFLPILFTELQKVTLRNRKWRRRVDEYFQSLDKSKKYAACIQHDDGLVFNTHGLDIKLFGMGCKGDVQLPLVCQPHKYEFKETERPIFASFIGSITHPIRKQMVEELQGKEGYFISTEHTSLHTYCYIMSQSKYCLSPRGYGAASFRQGEGLQYGATPVYISDEFLFDVGCINIPHTNFKLMDVFLRERNRDSFNNKQIFKNYYTYEAVANMIYENL